MNDHHFNPANLPDLEEVKVAFAELCTTIACLRDPQRGCPWDLQQTHDSLRKYMIEEAYEAVEAMSTDGAPEKLRDELGDVLLQVLLNAQIALDQQSFGIMDVIKGLNQKMRRRHPHVFGDLQQRSQRTIAEIKENWTKTKSQEQPQKEKHHGLMKAHGVGKNFPASLQAVAIGKAAAKINFDWQDGEEVWQQLQSEIREWEAEWNKAVREKARLQDELGDIYFTLAQLCRHLQVDPEVVAQSGNQKFLRRFETMEKLAEKRSKDIANVSAPEMQQLWNEAKEDEKNGF